MPLPNSSGICYDGYINNNKEHGMEIRTKKSRRGVDALDIWIDDKYRGTVFPIHRSRGMGMKVVTANGTQSSKLFANIDHAAAWLYTQH
jgi:hypothetical protein